MHNPYISILLNCLAVHIAFRDLYLCVSVCVCVHCSHFNYTFPFQTVQYKIDRGSIFKQVKKERKEDRKNYYNVIRTLDKSSKIWRTFICIITRIFGHAPGRLYNVSIIFTPNGPKDWLR
jgi:hypothetical protein